MQPRGFTVDSLLKVNFELDVDEEDRILTTPNSHRSLNPASPDKARRRYRISAHDVGASAGNLPSSHDFWTPLTYFPPSTIFYIYDNVVYCSSVSGARG